VSITPVNCSIRAVKLPDLNLVKRAWTLSRPKETDPDISKILEIDAPVNELTDIVLEFEVPILIREIICSLRDHRVWAQTSRVQDLTEWDIWKGVHPVDVSDLYKDMMRAKNANSDQDDYRMYLPLCYMTKFTASFSLRTYLKLCCFFKETSKEVSIVRGPISSLFIEVYLQMVAELSYNRELEQVLSDDKVKYDDICPIPNKWPGAGSERWGDSISVANTVPLALRAQIIRHRMFLVVDSLRKFFTSDSLLKPIGTIMDVQITTTVEVAKSIVSKRSCWISQTDLWLPIIEKMSEALSSKEEILILPCDDGTCPYIRDNQLRIEGKDPGIPCPMYAELYNSLMTSEQYEKAQVYASKRGNQAMFWDVQLHMLKKRGLVA
jgi:hypothetical protein